MSQKRRRRRLDDLSHEEEEAWGLLYGLVTNEDPVIDLGEDEGAEDCEGR